jgi:hypothetical protein
MIGMGGAQVAIFRLSPVSISFESQIIQIGKDNPA